MGDKNICATLKSKMSAAHETTDARHGVAKLPQEAPGAWISGIGMNPIFSKGDPNMVIQKIMESKAVQQLRQLSRLSVTGVMHANAISYCCGVTPGSNVKSPCLGSKNMGSATTLFSSNVSGTGLGGGPKLRLTLPPAFIRRPELASKDLRIRLLLRQGTMKDRKPDLLTMA